MVCFSHHLHPDRFCKFIAQYYLACNEESDFGRSDGNVFVGKVSNLQSLSKLSTFFRMTSILILKFKLENQDLRVPGV